MNKAKYDVLPCERVITIPQYIGTCWFNALLMATFYSEAVRDAIASSAARYWEPMRQSNERTRRLVKIFDIMLGLYKRPNDQYAYRFYDKYTPERILYYLHRADRRLMEYDAIVKKNGKYVQRDDMSAGYKVHMYAHKFLYFLRVPNVALQAVYTTSNTKTGPFRLCIGNSHSRTSVDFREYMTGSRKKAYSMVVKSPQYVAALLNSNPSVLVVDIGGKDDWKSQAGGQKRPGYYYLPGEHKRTLPEFIKLGRSTYVLDSCTFTNDNMGKKIVMPSGQEKKIAGHAIAGVTCNRRKFIYSGWLKKTKDAARGSEAARENEADGISATERPCPLMPFEWTKDPRNFYITSKECRVQLSPPKPDSVRFNANHGPRIYFYVRRDLVHYKKHTAQRLANALRSGQKDRAVRLGFSIAKQTLANALRRKARIDRADPGGVKRTDPARLHHHHHKLREHVRTIAARSGRRQSGRRQSGRPHLHRRR